MFSKPGNPTLKLHLTGLRPNTGASCLRAGMSASLPSPGQPCSLPPAQASRTWPFSFALQHCHDLPFALGSLFQKKPRGCPATCFLAHNTPQNKSPASPENFTSNHHRERHRKTNRRNNEKCVRLSKLSGWGPRFTAVAHTLPVI